MARYKDEENRETLSAVKRYAPISNQQQYLFQNLIEYGVWKNSGR